MFGTVIAVLAGAVVVGGITRTGAVTAKLVPSMAAVYVLGCIVVIAMRADQAASAFGATLAGAFTAEGVQGGVTEP